MSQLEMIFPREDNARRPKRVRSKYIAAHSQQAAGEFHASSAWREKVTPSVQRQLVVYSVAISHVRQEFFQTIY
jgi:hypothetical protein